jgi:hypothetical protein
VHHKNKKHKTMIRTTVLRTLAQRSAFLFFLLISLSYAAPSFTPGISATQMASILDGPGLAIINPRISLGSSQQYGIMTGGGALGFDTGVFLDTGDVHSVQGPNDNPAYGSLNPISVSLDGNIASINPSAAYDPVAFEFDIVPQGNKANFIFTFGSDEYPEFVCSQYNDAFGVFVSGPGISGYYNAAVIPGTGTPITVNNINNGSPGQWADGTACQLYNSTYFIDNGNGGWSGTTQLDGYTKTITSSVTGLWPGQVYHVKLILADAGDSSYDSGAIFKWLTSTNSTPVDLSLTATANKPNPVYNTEVELTWTIHNSSGTATDLVQTKLAWPGGLSWVGDDSGGAYNASTGIWEAGAIPAYGSKSLKIRAVVGSSASYGMTGEITFALNEDPDSTPDNRAQNPNEDDTATVSVWPVANSAPSMPSAMAVSIPENTTPVTMVTATDINGDSITYSIAGGSDANKFSINAQTGALIFNTAPDYEKPGDSDQNNTYVVQVSASDGQVSTTQTVTVTVTDVKENALPFIKPGNNAATYSASFTENTTSIVLDYDATDADGDTEDHGLTWLISGGADKWAFTINPDKGWLEFTGAPDFERPLDADKNDAYEVQVTVCDSVGGCSTQLLKVSVTDVPEDSDGDGLPDSAEIAPGTTDPFNNAKDSDKDGIPDYRDPDDDDDGILTKYENPDPNGDGNPSDARDTDKDGIPDYLDADDDGDGKPTNTENPDPNGDGDPADSDDMDDDGIPNYLDNNDEPSVRVTVRAFLQGPFDETTGMMDDSLRTLGFLPKLQPYGSLATTFGYSDVEGVAPLDYYGTETIPDATYATSGPDAIVDWVLVELRDAAHPATRTAIKAAVVQRDGDIVDAVTGKPALTFRGTPDGSYYVAVRHRNHLGIMTDAPISLVNTTRPIDFTKVTTPVYGTDQRRIETLGTGSAALMWAGDTNNSNSVIAQGPGSDALIMLSAILIAPENTLVNLHYQLAGYYASDINLDGYTVYSGPGNDMNMLLGNIQEHPDNIHSAGNYIISGALPH